MLYQQGDVLIRSVDSIPSKAGRVAKSHRGFILAEGEVTGHAHVVTDTEHASLFESDEKIYLKVLKDIEVTHEEHHKVIVAPGNYEISTVQEYDHFKEEARKVQD